MTAQLQDFHIELQLGLMIARRLMTTGSQGGLDCTLIHGKQLSFERASEDNSIASLKWKMTYSIAEKFVCFLCECRRGCLQCPQPVPFFMQLLIAVRMQDCKAQILQF